jgi:hypothetical protein
MTVNPSPNQLPAVPTGEIAPSDKSTSKVSGKRTAALNSIYGKLAQRSGSGEK